MLIFPPYVLLIAGTYAVRKSQALNGPIGIDAGNMVVVHELGADYNISVRPVFGRPVGGQIIALGILVGTVFGYIILIVSGILEIDGLRMRVNID